MSLEADESRGSGANCHECVIDTSPSSRPMRKMTFFVGVALFATGFAGMVAQPIEPSEKPIDDP